jgi:hypothetical protein
MFIKHVFEGFIFEITVLKYFLSSKTISVIKPKQSRAYQILHVLSLKFLTAI